jgi:hypothetical protein
MIVQMQRHKMTGMVRKRIYITRRQRSLLTRLSMLREISESEIVRLAIDREASNPVSGSQAARLQAYKKAYAFMLSLDEQASQSPEPYPWNR